MAWRRPGDKPLSEPIWFPIWRMLDQLKEIIKWYAIVGPTHMETLNRFLLVPAQGFIHGSSRS